MANPMADHLPAAAQPAEPVLLIPGLMCTAGLFAAQLPALWPHAPVMVASTLGGETMADIAQDILANAPPRFSLAGFSMGGYLAMEILRQAPERVARLALMDTSARPDTPEQTAGRRANVAEAGKGDQAFRDVLAKMFPNLLHPEHRRDAALLEAQMRMAVALGPAVFARQQAAIIGRIDSRETLQAVKVPTLVLVGDQDGLTPPERAQEMAELIPGAKLVTVPGAGHATPLEQPAYVANALVSWATRAAS